MSKINQPSDNMKERINNILNKVTDENLAKTFAYYSNQAKVIEPSEDNDEEFLFLLEVTEALSGFIVEKYMEERGFYQSAEEELNLWEHEKV